MSRLFLNHSCSSDVWAMTRSRMTFMSSSWALFRTFLNTSRLPYSGEMSQ